MACPLNGKCKRALMLRAVSCDPSRKDLAARLSFFCGIRSVFFCIRLLRFSDKPFELSLLFIPV